MTMIHTLSFFLHGHSVVQDLGLVLRGLGVVDDGTRRLELPARTRQVHGQCPGFIPPTGTKSAVYDWGDGQRRAAAIRCLVGIPVCCAAFHNGSQSGC